MTAGVQPLERPEPMSMAWRLFRRRKKPRADRAATPRRRRRNGDREPSPAVPPEVLRQVKLLELRTRGLVNSLFTGEYRSVFKGQGMEFAEVREYQPGDEVRSIDWNVTARMQRPYVKRYIEERELTVMLAVDVSGSERFGTRRRFKSEVASELAAVLAMSAIRNNDRVGSLMFTDRIEHVVPPRKGRRHALRLIRDILAFEPRGSRHRHRRRDRVPEQDARPQGDHLSRLRLPRREHRAAAQAARAAARRRRGDASRIRASDVLPDIGLVRLVDPETGADARRGHERSRASARSSTRGVADEADRAPASAAALGDRRDRR